MTHNTREVEEIREILIELTDATGFDHTPEALFAFERAKEKLHHQLQKARLEGLHAGIKRVAYYLEHKPRCYLYNEEGEASQCDCGLKEAVGTDHSELDQDKK